MSDVYRTCEILSDVTTFMWLKKGENLEILYFSDVRIPFNDGKASVALDGSLL